MADAFIEIQVKRRQRGRPTKRRMVWVTLVDGTRLEFGDQVPYELVWAIIEVVLPQARGLGGGPC